VPEHTPPNAGATFDRQQHRAPAYASHPGALITRRAAANFLGVSERLLERKALDGSGPPFVRISVRRLGYRISDLEAWLQARTFPHRAAELAKAVSS
jgi:predicted DNA-binding transcriptional regulator AlpA